MRSTLPNYHFFTGLPLKPHAAIMDFLNKNDIALSEKRDIPPNAAYQVGVYTGI